jgi:hypothetical protein
VTSKGRSRKRRGRPGVAPTPTKAPAKAHPPRSTAGSAVGADGPADAAVKPDRDPSLQQWTVSTWLMLASGLWSAIVAWQLVATRDDPVLAGEGPPLLLTGAAVITAIASLTAFQMLRKGSTARARTPILVAAVCGVFAVFSTVVSVVSLWLVRRDRR